jgi:hypothetical protein
MLLSELSVIIQDRSYFKISCSYFDIAAEVSGQELLWHGSSILVLLEKYPTTVRKFLMDYLRGGEGRSGAKRAVRGIGEVVEVNGVLQGQRWRCALGEAVEVDGALRGRRRWCAPSEVVEVNGMLQGQRWRRASGEAVKVDGVLRAKQTRSRAK